MADIEKTLTPATSVNQAMPLQYFVTGPQMLGKGNVKKHIPIVQPQVMSVP